jgi:hypothetical protein
MTELAVSVLESKWVEFSNAVRDREKCDIGCPMFASCPMTVYAPECLVTLMKEEDKRKMLTIFFMGEDGLKTEILSSLFRLSQYLNMKDMHELQIYLDSLLRVHRQLYTSKTKQPSPMQAVQIIMGDSVPNKKSDTPMVILEEKDSTADPDSLFNSPMMDTITVRNINGKTRSQTTQEPT